MPAPSRSRFLAVLYWTVPSILCLILYWYGFRAWFRMDDFAWLGLHTLIHDFDSFMRAMFTPLAQGTIRPLSERLFFVAGWHLFGLEAPPFRIIAFATMFGCLALLTAVTRRLTGSAIAGFLAPVLWMVNGNIYAPMSWTSAYNQILCAFCMLLALLLWIRYTETGETRCYSWQWVVFIVGFGALEINVVYPAIAALHACCFARRYLPRTLPMFAVSALYTLVHRLSAPSTPAPETYRMYFDAGIFHTLRKYLQWSFGADRYAEYRGFSPVPFYAAEALAGGALLIFVLAMLRRRQWLAAFAAGWFLIVIAPLLPLKLHVSDYYLTVPLIGLAVIGAWAVSVAWRGGAGVKLAAILLVLAYAVPSAWMARGMSRQFHDESRRYSNFVRSVAYAHQVHPAKRLLIRGVDQRLFHGAWVDNPFRIFGLRKIYMPGTPVPGFGTSRHFMAESVALEGMKRGEIIAYDVQPDGRLRNITPVLRAKWERTELPLPSALDIRDPLSEVHLLSGWWQAEANHRWMSKRARLQLAGPLDGKGELILRGSSLEATKIGLTLNGHAMDPANIPAGAFEVRFPVKTAAALDITLGTERTIIVPGDGRELGLMLTAAEVGP